MVFINLQTAGKAGSETDSGINDQNKDIMSIAMNPNNPKPIFAGLFGEDKLFWISTNSGESWLEYSTGLPDSGLIKCIEIDTLNDRIFSGVHGDFSSNSGLYISDLITYIKTTMTNADKFDLIQNYPNPFNPITTITYSLPKASNVTLKVYDILGRELVTLVDEFKSEGQYSVLFNASSLASGIYFYRI